MKSETRFTKIKFTKDEKKTEKVTLIWEKKVGENSWDEYSMVCSERAAPSFYKAMSKLTPFLQEICELPGAESLERMDVRGVSLSYAGPEDTMGATLIGTMTLKHSNSKLNLITPHKADMPYNPKTDADEADPNQLLPDGCAEAINRLCAEAQEYLDGKREQTKLVLKDGKKAASGDKD